MLDRMTRADAAGLQLCIHGIGDQAISTSSICLLSRKSEWRARSALPHRARAAPRAQGLPAFPSAHVIASMQPYHAIDDGRWAEQRIGPERIKTSYAFRSLLDAGAVLAFGTDWTVAPIDPLHRIHAAVTRADARRQEPDGWVPEQKITLDEAVEAYTQGSAYAEFQEDEKGTLALGKLADLILLDATCLRLSRKICVT